MQPIADGQLSTLAQTIQLVIAPVFLLTAIGAFLTAITTRLGRVIDRSRVLEKMMNTQKVDTHALIIAELASLDRRMLLANRAVGLAIGSALTICSLIMVLFISSFTDLQPYTIVPVLFIAALALLMAAFTSFAIEIRISIRTVRVRQELIQEAPRPPGDVHFPRYGDWLHHKDD